MKLKLVSFGHKKDPLYADALDEYAKRIVRPWELQLVDLPSERRSNDEPAAKVMKNEAAALQKTLARDPYWALCVEGDALTSEKLAEAMGRVTADMAFVIGGADGLDPEITRGAQRRFSLSKLTLPHRLARVVLVEQLYRAQSILRGEKYHK